MKQNKVIAFFLLAGVIIILHLLAFYHWLPSPGNFLFYSRLLIYLGLIIYAFNKKSLTTWIILSMILGVEAGHSFPVFSAHLKVVSKIFLRLIKTIIAPLLISTLSIGIAGHSDLKQLGRIAWKSIFYFEVVTTLALFIGIAAINISQAGAGILLPKDAGHDKVEVVKQTWEDVVLHVFPENIAKSIAEGQILQVVIFSIIFGISLAMVQQKFKAPMLGFLESLSEVMFKFTGIIMYFAPFAVFAAIAYTVSHMGLGILLNLISLLATLYAALFSLILFVFVPIALFCRINLLMFATAISEPVSIAFATTTSEAALPKAMIALEGLGASRKIISFVMPMGYSFNLDGSTLYLSLAAVFVAQAAGIALSIEQQLLMVFTLMLTSKGVAGVPRATLVVLLGTATSFGLPVEPIFIILGIDELMDMGRSSVNVIGNCLATLAIARWEGELKPVAQETMTMAVQPEL
jgi:proton glutamate symport protein